MVEVARAIVIGVSAGGIEALSAILPPLPANFPFAIMVVIHLPADRDSVVPQLLQAKCQLKVKEIEDKEPIVRGTVYIAPSNYHGLVEPSLCLSLSSEQPVHFSRPSIDVLFESAAYAYRERLLGVVLTGANSDGARGLRSVLDSGGSGLVQRPSNAHASAMPQAAIDACPEAIVMDLKEIAPFLLQLASRESE